MKTLRKITSFLLAAILAMNLALCVLPLFAAADDEEQEPSVIQDLFCQTLSGAEVTDEKTDLRLIFEVTASEVESLGFVFSLSNEYPTVDGENCTVKTVSTLYSSIQADGESIVADEGTYFAAVKLTNIPHAAFDTEICVCAFVETEEGEYVYSDVAYISVCDALEHEHTVTTESVYVPATFYSNGYWAGVCDECGLLTITDEDYSTGSTENYVWTSSNSGTVLKSLPITKVLQGNHFYPTAKNPEGNDLLIEYSLFWNESLLNLNTGSKENNSTPFISSRIANASGGDSANLIKISPTANIENSLCKYAGGMEAGEIDQITAEGAAFTPAGMLTSDGAYSDYPNLGGSDPDNPEYGWHRIGMRVHQEVTNLASLKEDTTAGATAAQYDVTVTVYLDGEAVAQLHGSFSNAANYLYTAESDGNGGVVYTDISSNRYIHVFHLNNGKANVGTSVYFALADLEATCGKEFNQNVRKLASPVATDNLQFKDDRTTMKAVRYYELAN